MIRIIIIIIIADIITKVIIVMRVVLECVITWSSKGQTPNRGRSKEVAKIIIDDLKHQRHTIYKRIKTTMI